MPPQARAMVEAQRMASFIAQNLMQRLSVETAAKAVGLHPSYAMSMLKDALGLTVGQYITKQRLSQALAMLLSSDLDVARIAFESGFGSVGRFYDAFTAAVGVTPRRSRAQHRAPAAV